MDSFGDYFKESMDAVHMPVPSGLFDTWQKALVTSTALVNAIAKFGTKVTLAEILKSAPAALPSAVYWQEVLFAVGGVSAAWYAGCLIGATFYATQRSLGLDALSISNKIEDILNEARKSGIVLPDQVSLAIRQRSADRIKKTFA